ncbi:Rho GTPase activating protein [Cryptotrichosporon argae]
MPDGRTSIWTVGKLPSAFVELDTRLRARSGKVRKEWRKLVAPLPDGKAWKDFAPSRIDQRKVALELYLHSVLVAPLSDKADLCEFLTTDLIVAHDRSRKEGYLTKKGKNFGGWKSRYFVAAGPVLEYYESRGGAHLGSIAIAGAQIGRQNRTGDAADERDFRHAFLIIEAAKRGVHTRHVLCAESDPERDDWIEALVRYVDAAPAPTPPVPPALPAQLQRKRSVGKKLSKDVVVTAAQPLTSLPLTDAKFTGAPSPSLINARETQKQAEPSRVTSPPPVTFPPLPSPTAETFADDPTPRANKRQSSVPVRQSFTPAYLSSLSNNGLSAPPGYVPERERERDRKAKSGRFWAFGKVPTEKAGRPVFGVPLADSISVSSIASLPAIVFRCIEYLEAKGAEREEGIYRLSGSSAVIKGLKDRFDADGDVNLLALDNRWDPHAIAGLLKSFLRELPTSLLTRELHLRFLVVMDLVDSSDRVDELSRLVSDLPPPNYALLRALTAHLIQIVCNADINKMTLRNIGIVFSPTLGIPAGIFSELVINFGRIFDDEPAADADLARDKRNSVLYQAGGTDAMLGLTGRTLDPATEDSASASELSLDADSETRSVPADESPMSP